MTYDPYQTYSPVGAYPGITGPINFPYGTGQTGQNAPAATLSPLAAAALGLTANIQNQNAGLGQNNQPFFGAAGNQQVGISPQQLQLAAAILASQGIIPQLQNQSPYGNGSIAQQWAAGLQNPQFNAGAGPQYGYPQQQHHHQGQGPQSQLGSPYGQVGQQQFGVGYQNNPNQGSPFQNNQFQSNPLQGNAFQGNPYQGNPYQSNPYQSNPYQSNPYQQNQSNPYQANQGFAQGIPYGAGLAPQSWVGQAGAFGASQPFAQNNPLANQLFANQLLANQLGQRFQGPGIAPWQY
jgi:hypothetical protein